MNPSVTRVLGASLALLGLFLAASGAWFLAHVGTSGRAQFTANPASSVIVIPETVLNNLGTPAEVTIRAGEGATVWAGTTTPSTADAILAESKYVELSGVSVRPWQITTTLRGSAELPNFAVADVWRITSSGKQTASVTVDPSRAPEVLIAQSSSGDIAAVELGWKRSAWFVQSLLAMVIGLALLIGGALLVRRSVHTARFGSSLDRVRGSERGEPNENLSIVTVPKETS